MINLYNEDCLAGMSRIPDGSVDCVLADLPFGITALPYDKKLDLTAFWAEINRLLKPCCSAVLFASGKFTHELIASNFDRFKYKWIWVKNAPTLFVHAKNRPMSKYEEICVFSDGVINHANLTTRRMKYNPQGLTSTLIFHGENELTGTQLRRGKRKPEYIFNTRPSRKEFYVQERTNYPADVLKFKVPSAVKKVHPNEKPVDLLEYLIRTYTNEGETVLDATMCSGSAGVAAVNTGRNFIGFETEQRFYEIAQKRINEALDKRGLF